jgi:hypothetical protein
VVPGLNVTSQHELEISAVEPSSGSVAWSHPYSASLITPGVAFTPIAIGNTVLVLLPAHGSNNPSVSVEGVDAGTGKRLWAVPQPLVLSDAPVVCATGQYFCIPTYASASSTGLVALNPLTGAVTGTVQGPLRNMAVVPPGSLNDSDLWQTNASAPTLMQTSATGQQVWTQTIASLFGGSQFNPNYGWDFVVNSQLDIGSVGVAPIGKTEPLDGFKTLGISTSTGSVVWSMPGYLFCGGALQFLTADILCQYVGSAHSNGTKETMPGVKLTLEGLNPISGATTWTKQVQDAQALSLGTNIAFRDGTHIVVQPLVGKRVVLDVVDANITPVSANEVFWCEQVPTYKLNTPKGASEKGVRVSTPVFRACSADGKPVAGLPPTSPSTVGVSVDGLFIWPTPVGLQATRQPVSP